MLSKILRAAALVYLFIGAGLVMAAKAVEKPGGACLCSCECPTRGAEAPEPEPLSAADLAPVAMLDA